MYGIELFDIVVIVLVIGMTVRGGLSGMIGQILSIVSLLLCWYCASQHYMILETWISPNTPWGKPVSMIAVFVLCWIALKILLYFLHGMLRLVSLRELDRQLGALFGLIKGVILALILTFFAVMCNETTSNAVGRSQSGKYMVAIILMIDSYIPNNVNSATLKTELAKFKATADDAGLVDVAIGEDITALKSKLENTVIDSGAVQKVMESATDTWNSLSNKSVAGGGTEQTATNSSAPARQAEPSPFSFQLPSFDMGSFLTPQRDSGGSNTGNAVNTPTTPASVTAPAPLPDTTTVPPSGSDRPSTGSILYQPSFSPQTVAPTFK